MIKLIERYFHFADGRGSIEGIINTGIWREINIITSAADTMRGNHYHTHIRELFIIIDGSITVTLQQVQDGRLIGPVRCSEVGPGDSFIVDPYWNHTFQIRSEARWINVLSQSLDEQNKDIHRITV
jgi:mannose-6-phosphate isomerase-like protein (cupin superfamily)